ncbi:MAG: TetR/AcrR family transcriptional regulator [Schleiferiaceae bacterium]|nr:TetR/AcrR family transcriptional regulator [Schleiferiaceae bacterium]
MAIIVQIQIHKNLFLRDPEKSDLGRNIIGESIKLIDTLGFEAFTFKKLAIAIGSTEASIYRYFENKHKLLIYLISWYWGWLEFQIDYSTNSIEFAEDKLKKIIEIISEAQSYDPNVAHIDEAILNRIVVAESSKVYLTKNVIDENKEGLFVNYKSLISKIANIIKEVNASYPYPRTLASNMIETSHEQLFFAKHLNWLTDLRIDNGDLSALRNFLEHIVFSAIHANIIKSN